MLAESEPTICVIAVGILAVVMVRANWVSVLKV